VDGVNAVGAPAIAAAINSQVIFSPNALWFVLFCLIQLTLRGNGLQILSSVFDFGRTSAYLV
jgi:hypothetical protein